MTLVREVFNAEKGFGFITQMAVARTCSFITQLFRCRATHLTKVSELSSRSPRVKRACKQATSTQSDRSTKTRSSRLTSRHRNPVRRATAFAEEKACWKHAKSEPSAGLLQPKK